jgi:hypothetical protein
LKPSSKIQMTHSWLQTWQDRYPHKFPFQPV